MTDFTLRRYAAGDLPALEAVYAAAIAAIDEALYPPAQKRSWQNRPNRSLGQLADSCQTWVFAAPAGRIAGFFAFTSDGSVFELLYMHPDFQGQGLARQAVNFALDYAAARGAPVMKTNASLASHPLFLRLGFTDLGRRYTERDGLKIPYHMMQFAFAPAK